jgi:hypothetical protein
MICYATIPTETPVIHIQVVRGKGPWEDFNPYVELRLVPDDPELGSQVQKSSHKPRNNKPCWEPPQAFKYVVSDNVDRAKIVVSVVSEETALGVGYLSVKTIGKELESKTIKLSNPDSGKPGVGEIEINVYMTTIGEAARHDQHICYEFQRCNIVSEWGAESFTHLLPTDPGRYCSSTGQNFSMKFGEVTPEIPYGWEMEMNWRVVATTVCHQ